MSAAAGIPISSGLDREELMRLTEEMAKGVRLSGSEDERRAFDFAESYLSSAGLETERLRTEALIAYPLDATLEVLAPERIRVEAWGNSMAPSTPEAGLEAELAYGGAGGSVAGQVVLVDAAVRPAEGEPLAYVRADVDPQRIHERGVSPIWGNPTPVTLPLLPRTPSVGISGGDGARLKALLDRGPVRVRVRARMHRDWTPIPVLIANVPGTEEPDFTVFSAHIDSWYLGAMDNASANAIQLQLARLLHENRGGLRRGVRIAFWSGHSQGKFAGSTWYADTHWQELFDHCVCHVYVDSAGAEGATVLGDSQTMAETYGFTAGVILRTTGQRLRYFRIARAGDQSFWGIGVPSTLVLPSLVPVASGQAVPQVGASAENEGGLPWFWHTPEDTIDKIDPDNLLRDARVYAETLWELSTAHTLPFDYRPAATEMRTALERHQESLGRAIDLGPAVEAARDFEAAASAWEASPPTGTALRNQVLKRLGRTLIPAAYTQNGPFDQDPGADNGPFPGIAGGLALSRLAEGTDQWRALQLQTMRHANRATAALTAAARLLS
jgi:hypothetical protein